MPENSSAVQSLHRQTDSAASFCSFCKEYGHSHWDCIRYAMSRIEAIECAWIDDQKTNPWTTLIILVIGGIVGGAMGAFFTLVLRGIVR